MSRLMRSHFALWCPGSRSDNVWRHKAEGVITFVCAEAFFFLFSSLISCTDREEEEEEEEAPEFRDAISGILEQEVAPPPGTEHRKYASLFMVASTLYS